MSNIEDMEIFLELFPIYAAVSQFQEGQAIPEEEMKTTRRRAPVPDDGNVECHKCRSPRTYGVSPACDVCGYLTDKCHDCEATQHFCYGPDEPN